MTSATSVTETLSVETYTVDSFQHYRRAAQGETCERLQRQESIRHNHSPQTVLDNPRIAVTYTAPVPVVEYVAPAPTVEYAASVTTMTVPTTVDTHPVVQGSDYFSSSVACDVWYAVARPCRNLRYAWRNLCGLRLVSEREHRRTQLDLGHKEPR